MAPKRRQTLAAVRRGPFPSVYALAEALGRPYRRVWDDVKALEAAGLIETRPATAPATGRRRVEIFPRSDRSGDTPTLVQRPDVAWSRPAGVDASRALDLSLHRPSLTGLVEAVRVSGIDATRKRLLELLARRELDDSTAWLAARILSNIERGIGHEHAA